MTSLVTPWIKMSRICNSSDSSSRLLTFPCSLSTHSGFSVCHSLISVTLLESKWFIQSSSLLNEDGVLDGADAGASGVSSIGPGSAPFSKSLALSLSGEGGAMLRHLHLRMGFRYKRSKKRLRKSVGQCYHGRKQQEKLYMWSTRSRRSTRLRCCGTPSPRRHIDIAICEDHLWSVRMWKSQHHLFAEVGR